MTIPHADTATDQDITHVKCGQITTSYDHMHVSDGGVITSVGEGHTHSNPTDNNPNHEYWRGLYKNASAWRH